MIGPVSGTGRAMMASLQQAIQKGMPPDQAVQYVKSMATQGVAPLTDLYAMLNQFQRLKQQPVQAPQTPPTIRDQLNMMEQQQAMMQQGVASLPAPVMDQAQFAGGGIVAFQEGGLTAAEEAEYEKLQDLMAEGVTPRGGMSPFGGASPSIIASSPAVGGLQALYEKRFKELRAKKAAAERAEVQAERQAAITAEGRARGLIPPPAPTQTAVPPPAPDTKRPAPPRTDTTPRAPAPRRPVAGSPVSAAPRVEAAAPAAPKMPSAADFEQQLQERNKPFAEATERFRTYLQGEEATSKEEAKRDRMLTLAQAGFAMAEAASKPGATFLGSVGAAGGDFAKSMMQLNREAAVAKRNMQKELLALDQAKAANDVNMYNAALSSFMKDREFVTQVDQFNQGVRLQREGLDIQRAELALRNTGLNAEIARAAARDARDDRDYLQKVHEFTVGARIKVAELAREETADLIRTPTYMDATPEVQEQMIQDVNNRIAQRIFGGGSGTGVGAGSSGIQYLGSRPSGK